MTTQNNMQTQAQQTPVQTLITEPETRSVINSVVDIKLNMRDIVDMKIVELEEEYQNQVKVLSEEQVNIKQFLVTQNDEIQRVKLDIIKKKLTEQGYSIKIVVSTEYSNINQSGKCVKEHKQYTSSISMDCGVNNNSRRYISISRYISQFLNFDARLTNGYELTGRIKLSKADLKKIVAVTDPIMEENTKYRKAAYDIQVLNDKITQLPKEAKKIKAQFTRAQLKNSEVGKTLLKNVEAVKRLGKS